MKATSAGWIAIAAAAVLVGCWSPADSRPGLHLAGDVATPPSDWSFTRQYPEIALEVHTPYLVSHSVTIWCAAVGGQLYVGARAPETKRWPGYVDRDADVRLGIGEKIYEVRLTPLDDRDRIAQVRAAYASKYELPDPPPAASPPVRYWTVDPRGSAPQQSSRS